MRVKCIKGCENANLIKGKIYFVNVIVEKGKLMCGEWDKGYILENPTCHFPYIWSKNRFKIIKD